MPKIVLTNGKIIETTPEQQDRLAMVIMLTDDMSKSVRVGEHTFKIEDIETDHNKISQAGQGKMFDITPTKSSKKRQMG